MYALGIDIGGTNTAYGIVDIHGTVRAQRSLPTTGHASPEDFVQAVAADVRALLAAEGITDLVGAGVGAPNGNYYRGTVEHAPNLAWKGVVPLAQLFRSALELPVVLTNDANAAAIGEMVYGGARGMRDFLVVTLGTGLGSGFVAGGSLIYGHDGFAGELGHTIVDPHGRQCACMRRGCLETYVSAPGIRRTVMELLADDPTGTELAGVSFEALTAQMITAAAEGGDRAALAAFEVTGEILGRALADAVAITSPEAIFLFGGLANAGDFILEPTRRHFEAALLNIFRGRIRIERSHIHEANGAVLGASALVWNERERGTLS